MKILLKLLEDGNLHLLLEKFNFVKSLLEAIGNERILTSNPMNSPLLTSGWGILKRSFAGAKFIYGSLHNNNIIFY